VLFGCSHQSVKPKSTPAPLGTAVSLSTTISLENGTPYASTPTVLRLDLSGIPTEVPAPLTQTPLPTATPMPRSTPSPAPTVRPANTQTRRPAPRGRPHGHQRRAPQLARRRSSRLCGHK